MNRRGSLEWKLETLGKLIIGVAVLLVLILLGMRLVDLFTGGSDRAAAEHTFDLLSDRIALAGEIAGASVIIDVPNDHMIVGFRPKGYADADGVFVQGKWFGWNDVTIPRPAEGGEEACLCLLETAGTPSDGKAATKTVECLQSPVSFVSTRGRFTFEYRDAADLTYTLSPYATIVDGRVHYPVVFAGPPLSVRITVTGSYIELDTTPGDLRPCDIVYDEADGIQGEAYCRRVSNPTCVGGFAGVLILCKAIDPGRCSEFHYPETTARATFDQVIAAMPTRPPACRTAS